MLETILGPAWTPAEFRPVETRATKQTLGHPRDASLGDYFSGGSTYSGTQVSHYTALTISAVYRAINLVGSSVAKLPVHVYRQLTPEKHERQQDHPAEYVLNIKANDEMDAMTFKRVVQASALTYGTGYAEPVFRRGDLSELWFQPAGRIDARRVDGRVVYQITDEAGGPPQTVPMAQLFTLIGASPDGIIGYSPLRLARETLGLALATERFGATFFGNGAVPRGVFTYEGRSSEQAEREFREQWNQVHQSPQNANKIGLLRAGYKFQPITIPPEEAQFLGTRKFSIQEIARWFDVPPHLLFELEHAHFDNIEQQSLELLLYGIDPWLCAWEQRLRHWLLSDKESRAGFFFQFDRRAMHAMDSKSRTESNRTAIAAGYRSRNEARVLEGDNPGGPELDLYDVPLNVQGAKSALAKEEESVGNALRGVPAAGAAAPPAPETPADAAAQGKIAMTGLNAQQITAILAIISAVQDGSLPKPTAKAVLSTSFPMLAEAAIASIIDPLEIKEPPPPVAPALRDGDQRPAQPAAGPSPPNPASPAGFSDPAKGAALRNLSDAVGRMRHREIAAARKASQKPGEWCTWLDRYYANHETELRSALAAGADVFAAAYRDETRFEGPWLAWEVARRHCDRQRQALLSAADGDAAGFGDRIQQLTDEWGRSTPEVPLPFEVG